MAHTTGGRTRFAYVVMVVAPLFFSTNLIFGRGVIGEVSPFLLAFLRWLAVAIALSPFMWAERQAVAAIVRSHWRLVLTLAFLGMWLCGAGVYVALDMTTATNGTLIYTTSPVIILLIEAAFKDRRIGLREGVGAIIALCGIATIVLRGHPASILTLGLNVGDIIFVAAAVAWAVYSILQRTSGLQKASNAALLGLLAVAGAVLLLPFAAFEIAAGAPLPGSAAAWGGIAGIVVFASLLAFSSFQFGIRMLGAPLAGVFMYLMPPYGVMLAVIFLGERLEPFHAAGIALVMGGVILATLPTSRAGN